MFWQDKNKEKKEQEGESKEDDKKEDEKKKEDNKFHSEALQEFADVDKDGKISIYEYFLVT